MSHSQLGEYLVKRGLITAYDLKLAQEHQQKWKRRLGYSFIEMNLITEVELAQALSHLVHLPLIDITRINPSTLSKDLLSRVPLSLARNYAIVPIGIKKVEGQQHLILACADPEDGESFAMIQKNNNMRIVLMISTPSDIDWFIRTHYVGRADANDSKYLSVFKVKGDQTRLDHLNVISMSDFFGSSSEASQSSKDDETLHDLSDEPTRFSGDE